MHQPRHNKIGAVCKIWFTEHDHNSSSINESFILDIKGEK